MPLDRWRGADLASIAADMTDREFADKDLRCDACGDGFVLSAGEQELFRLRGITAQPERCPTCVRGRTRTVTRTNSAERSST